MDRILLSNLKALFKDFNCLNNVLHNNNKGKKKNTEKKSPGSHTTFSCHAFYESCSQPT